MAAAALVVVAGVAVFSSGSPEIFEPYFSGVLPPVAAAVVLLISIPMLVLLERQWGFEIYAGGGRPRRWLVSAALSVPFMVAVTVADLVLGFPVDLNVPLPAALAFYPIMGLMAQLALHVVPLAVLLSIGALVVGRARRERLVVPGILLVALVEAGFQLESSLADRAPISLGAFVVIHLFLFGVVELLLYRRYDYACMYVFRICYYGYWHVAWGWLRLHG